MGQKSDGLSPDNLCGKIVDSKRLPAVRDAANTIQQCVKKAPRKDGSAVQGKISYKTS